MHWNVTCTLHLISTDTTLIRCLLPIVYFKLKFMQWQFISFHANMTISLTRSFHKCLPIPGHETSILRLLDLSLKIITQITLFIRKLIAPNYVHLDVDWVYSLKSISLNCKQLSKIRFECQIFHKTVSQIEIPCKSLM